MEINASSLIRHPRERVFRAYRDELPLAVTFLPNVKEIIVRSRTEDGSVVKLHNEWVGKGEIPRIAQGLLSPEMLRWDDFAEWDEAAMMCRWKLGLRVFNDKFRCSGTNTITAEGAGTRVTLRGDLQLELSEIPGVPRILAGRIKPQVESFIIALVRPNLEQVNQALGKYLDAKG